jgi:hypothetical protein
MVTPQYFSTFGIRLLKGRAMNEQDTPSNVKVVMLNEEFVNRYPKGADPSRQRLSSSN